MTIILILSMLFPTQLLMIQEVQPIPVIYVTDLFHPKDDADDVYDLTALYAMPFDVKGIVLEQGLKQDERSGSVSVDQMNEITGRDIPYTIGLANPLVTKTDTGESQLAKYQGGVEMILDTLRNSTKRVSIISVGSLRDVAAAYNRDPELFKKKADRIFVFGGEATIDFEEYNVDLDPYAYAQIMNSGLNIYWVPCFDGGLWQNNGNSSYWRAGNQKDLLKGIQPELMNYFIYNLLDRTGDPSAYLDRAHTQVDIDEIYARHRNLWCTVVFNAILGAHNRDLFDFEPVKVRFTDEGYPRYEEGKMLMRYVIKDKVNYSTLMSKETNKILKQIESQ